MNVVINFDYDHAEIIPALAAELAPCLHHVRVGFAADGNRLRPGAIRATFYCHDADADRLIVRATLVHRVTRELQRLGHKVELRDCRRDPPLGLLWGHGLHVLRHEVDEVEASFPGLADAVDRHPVGTIIVRGSDRELIIDSICRLFLGPLPCAVADDDPVTRVFVACATRKDAQNIASGLQLLLGDKMRVGLVRGYDWRSPCRVVVGTFAAFERSQPSDYPIVIIPDAEHVLAASIADTRWEYAHSRIYTLARPHRPRSHRDDLRLEEFAGPVIYTTSAARRQRPDVIDVVFVNYAAPAEQPPESIGRHESKSERRRQRLEQLRAKMERFWKHKQRNRVIVDVANAIFSCNTAVLERHGISESVAGAGFIMPDNPAVLIIAGGPEQARCLKKLLADWHCHTGATALPDAPSTLWGIPPKSIVTMMRAESHRKLSADVVIVAGGGNMPQVPSSLLQSQCQQLLLIDFADDYTADVVRDTCSRVRRYQSFCSRVQCPRWATEEMELLTAANVRRGDRRRRNRRSRRRT